MTSAASHRLDLTCFERRLRRVFCAEDPLVGSIAQQYLTDREAHDKQAAEWTRRFAQG
jgi:ubiquitin-protein ligase